MVGSVVARVLANAGHDVTTIVREAHAATRALPPSVREVKGDVERPETLQGAADADVVFFAISVSPKQGRPDRFNPDRDGLANLVKVVAGRPGARVLYVASLLQDHNPHDWWVLRHKAEATSMLERSAVPHTIFKPSNFFENLPQRNLRGRSIGLIGKPRHRNWWIAAEDFGRQVEAHVAALPARSEPAAPNRTFVVQGPEAMTYEEAARRFAAAYSRERLKVSHAPVPIFRLLGAFVPELKYALEISQAINHSPEAFMAQPTWDELGRPSTTIEQFARGLVR